MDRFGLRTRSASCNFQTVPQGENTDEENNSFSANETTSVGEVATDAVLRGRQSHN